jgi:hypothetical protein
MLQATLARGAQCLGRAKLGLVLEPTEVLSDGSFLAHVYPDPKARQRDRRGLRVRVIESVLETLAQPSTQPYRVVTSLLDERASPAQTLAALDHERWEIETALDEVKVHQGAHPKPLRSQHPREVVQEIDGLLLAHPAIRTLLHQAAERLPPRRPRSHPRAVKRTMSHFPRTDPTHHLAARPQHAAPLGHRPHPVALAQRYWD